MKRTLLLLCLLVSLPLATSAQIGAPIPFGANQPSIDWFEIVTEHFRIIYHEGLEEEAEEAAAIAEAIYPVVTGNLQTEISGRTPMVLSDLDDVSNAIALGDKYMFIWMRGIVADGNFGGIRSAGRAKWLRTVITHEFTHIVVDEAASFFNLRGFQPPLVPRWFNEGTARAMEPDGWTSDVDQVLRLAFDADDVEYDGSDVLDGHLLYEGGQSLVRFMMAEYGDDVIAEILKGGRDLFQGYTFSTAVFEATGDDFGTIYENWESQLEDYYETELGRGDRISNVGTRIPLDDLRAITWALTSPDGSKIAYAGVDKRRRFGIYVGDFGSEDVDCISREPGLEGVFAWDSDGRSLIVSKTRYAKDRTLTHDLYRLSLSGSLDRITSDENLSDPTIAPGGSEILAIRTVEGRGDLVSVDPSTGVVTPITRFRQDIQIYTPRVSPNGRQVAFSMFDADGGRYIGVIDLQVLRRDGRLEIDRVVRDTANNRYPVWSPDGSSILYTSHAGGVPNLRRVDLGSGAITQVTRVTDGLYATDWIRGSESVVAIAIESPGDVTPWRVSAQPSGDAPLSSPTGDPWQSVAFDLTVPEVDAIKPPTIISRGGYESIAGITPIFPILPFLQSDIPTDNFNEEFFPYRIAAFSIWWDPMQKHQILAYVDYGLASQTTGFEVFYVNNTLPISVALHLDQSIALDGVIPGNSVTPDVAYFRKASGGDITLAWWLPATDALDVFHEFRLRYENNTKRAEGRTGDVARAEQLFGVEHTVETLGLGYTWTTPNLWTDAAFERGLSIGGGDFDYDKLEAHISGQLPLIYPFRAIGTVHAIAQFGEQIPYDFVGLNRYDLLSTDVGLSLRTLTDYTIRVRGVTDYVFGDRAWTATAGLELGFDWISALRGYGLGLMMFVEKGSAWYADDEDLQGFTMPDVFGWGGELRIPYLEKMHLGLGLATGSVDDVDYGVEFFTRVGWGF